MVRFPVPLLQAEVEPWSLPSPAARFSLHPAGVLVLYERTRAVLDAAGVLGDLDSHDRKLLGLECWRIAWAVFEPGEPVRPALEQLAGGKLVQASADGLDDQSEKLWRVRLAYLAAWAVCRAACEMTVTA